MVRCKMVFLLPKIRYSKYSELYWPSYVHFNSGAAFGVGFHWRRALPPHFSRHLLHIHQFQHSSVRLGLFGDVPSHPRLYRNLLYHQRPTSQLWVIQKPTLYRSPFARPHTVSITVGHKHYRVSLSLDLRLSWFWVNHIKPLSSVALHIQQRLRKRELYAMGTIAS